MTNILFILKLFVSSSSFERISPISRCLNLPLRVKLFGWTTRFSIFNEIAIHDKDRHGEKPICRVSIRASVLQRKIYGRGLKPFAIFFFFFSPPFSQLHSRVSRRTMEACVNDKGGWRNDTVPRRSVPVELFSPVESGVTVLLVSTSSLFFHFLSAMYPPVARWVEIQSYVYF